MKTAIEPNDIQKSWRTAHLGPVITADYVYYNEVHYKWMPVPVHWIGLHTSEVSDRVVKD